MRQLESFTAVSWPHTSMAGLCRSVKQADCSVFGPTVVRCRRGQARSWKMMEDRDLQEWDLLNRRNEVAGGEKSVWGA